MPCISRRMIPKLPSPLIHIAALGPPLHRRRMRARATGWEAARATRGTMKRGDRNHQDTARPKTIGITHCGTRAESVTPAHGCRPHPRRHRRRLRPADKPARAATPSPDPPAKCAPRWPTASPTRTRPPHAPAPTPKTAPITPHTGRTAGPGNATAPRDAEPHTGAQSALLAITVRATPVGGGRPARDRSLPPSTRCSRTSGSDPAPPTRRQPGPCLSPALYPPDT